MNSIFTDIQMVDLKSQYQKIKTEVDQEILDTITSAAFINGPKVKQFQEQLERYLNVASVVPCANGTDALQIAMMALGLQPGDEVIVPAFTYVATAEVIALLHLKPVMIDVDPDHFNVTIDLVKQALTPKTKAIVPVHLFGQSTDMIPLVKFAREHNLYIIEDNAQSIGANVQLSTGNKKTGTVGHVGTTSFYPAKNLGCFGDGGAIFTNDEELAVKIKAIANHGQSKKRYYHDWIGVNSRLDAIQAAVLNVKLKHLDNYIAARNKAADFYDDALKDIAQIQTPKRVSWSNHVFHQYTLKVPKHLRDRLKEFLQQQGIPSMIYYPVPLYKQKAFLPFLDSNLHLPVTEQLCDSVISLPMHTELNKAQLNHISEQIHAFFNQNE